MRENVFKKIKVVGVNICHWCGGRGIRAHDSNVTLPSGLDYRFNVGHYPCFKCREHDFNARVRLNFIPNYAQAIVRTYNYIRDPLNQRYG